MEQSRSKLKQAWENVWRKSGAGSDPKSEAPARQKAMRFTASDIARLDAAGLSNRGDRNAAANANNLSLTLRVVGDYLDRKNAREFTISWSMSSVSVYDDKREDFSSQNLYDGGLHMYLRRSNRVPAR
jgi:hypothetical protein